MSALKSTWGKNWGGVTVVATATGMAHTTIKRGMRELEAISEGSPGPAPVEKVRRAGGGRKEYRKKGQPAPTRTHDFPDDDLGKAIPYGVYDVRSNEGWVNVGIDHDTARFAVNSILSWWQEMGQRRFPRATRLLITADAGGSNGWRVRLWKVALQDLANELQLNLTICHFPPGTSKWNKIEHRLFSFITQNWRGKPLYDLQTIVNLISNTTTEAGLTVKCAVDLNNYEKGIKVSDEELARVALTRHSFHGEWNYTIRRYRR